jgi:hypothetical protein
MSSLQSIKSQLKLRTSSFVNIISNATIARSSPSMSSSSSSSTTSTLHIAMYASHPGSDDRFCRSIESALAHDVRLQLLGWKIPWRGLSQKLEAVYHLSHTLPPNDIILFIDAYDVMFAGNETEILARFLRLNASIVFAAECGCWPHIAEDPNICYQAYPASPTSARYLNSGTWIGYAKEASVMLKAVMQEAGTSFDNANDQKLMADLYIQHRSNIQLDFYSLIFQSMHATLDCIPACCNPRPNLNLVQQQQQQYWFNHETHTQPLIFHFNGTASVLTHVYNYICTIDIPYLYRRWGQGASPRYGSTNVV